MSKKKFNIPQVKFRISEIGIDEISLQPYKVEILPPGKEGFIFETSVGMNINFDERKIIIGVYLRLFSDIEKTNSLGELKTRTSFILENFSDITVKEKNAVKIPEFVMINFITIALSTARGVFAAYTNNTPLKDAVMPAQDPVFFAKKLQIQNIEKLETA